jgi:hypothetical protein
MIKILAAAVLDDAPQKRAFALTDSHGHRVPTIAHKLRIEQAADGTAVLRCFDDLGRDLTADSFDNTDLARNAAFEKFAVKAEDWYKPIYVDAKLPATLRHALVSLDFLTLREAVIAWRNLPDEQKRRATVKVVGKDGRLFKAADIERLHYEPKPENT